MNSNPLKRKLVCLLGLLSGFFLGLFALVTFDAQKTVQKETETKARTEAERTLTSVEREISKSYSDVVAFAQSEAARSGVPAHMTAFMNEMVRASTSPHILMMALNLKGKVVAVNSVDKKGQPLDTSLILTKNFADEEWFKMASQGEVEPGTAVVDEPSTDAIVAELYNSSGKVMGFTAPIRNADGTRVLGIWTTRVDWNEVVESTIGSLAQAKNEGFRALTITNDEGLFLFHSKGESYELKKTDPGFEQKNASFTSDSNTLVTTEPISLQNRGRTRVEASVRSTGFGDYSGLGWIFSVQTRTPNSHLKTVLASALCATLASLVGFLVLLSLVRGVANSGGQVNEQSHSTANDQPQLISNEINDASKVLAAAMGEQASSLQKTALHIEELNSMVNKTLETAKAILDMGAKSKEFAQKEKTMVDEMIQSVERIQTTQTAVSNQIEQSKARLAPVTTLMTALREKSQNAKDNVVQIRKESA